MTSEAISLFYDQPATTAAERAAVDAWTGAEPGEGIAADERRTTDAYQDDRAPDPEGCPECGEPLADPDEEWCDCGWAGTIPEIAPPAPAPDLAPGELVRWRDEAGVPHVGRVEGTTGDRVTVTYGPRPHRETLAPFELEPVTDKDGTGRLR